MPDDATPTTHAEVETPIINSPFEEPREHWVIRPDEKPRRAEGRRQASYFYRVPEHARAGRAVAEQEEMFESGQGEEVPLDLVNTIRARVKQWRDGALSRGVAYDGASAVTRELLELWRSEDRMQRLFFAQVEAAETIIFLHEAPEPYTRGLNIPRDEPGPDAKEAGARAFVRQACKMATGSGKTTVMGMLIAWSILNRRASPQDRRFSDTVLIVCPNVTIRERLQELDPARGDLSLYRTRQLVPPHRMEELRRGEVMIANWHRLAKKETGSVHGTSARVVRTGERVVQPNGDVKFFESDAAWFRRIRRELGNGRGRSPHWLVFNDEAHHAYRRGLADGGGVAAAEVDLDEDRHLAERNRREATIWIEGLDRIHRLAAGSGRGSGIRLCVDLSATPFYIQGSGNEVGRPFPWIVSDFGLLDAIESGLVKTPQLPARDASGAAEAAYFNIWRWVQERVGAEDGGADVQLTPDVVLSYASAPINLLAEEWREHFREWEKSAKAHQQHPVPPAFIVVCRDTELAKKVHEWLAHGNDLYGASPEEFRNAPGREVTVRIDSQVVHELEEGNGQDEVRRLRFILDTVGKAEWPGGKVPEEWAALVHKHNEKVAAGDGDGALQWVDERVPPGRDVRCIVSVAMLSEGWDANTVTHIVGLRPFGSQLLCEQVVGRALRRKHYVLDEESGMFAEESAKIFGVPFELIPFKVRPQGPPAPPREVHHIYSMPERAEYEIDFPKVTGYHQSGSFEVEIDWSQVAGITLDPGEIPPEVEVAGMAASQGSLVGHGPGEPELINLDEWRKRWRDQEVAFRLAKEICREWREDHGAEAVPTLHLFTRVVAATKRFLAEKVECRGNTQPCDVLAVGEYARAAINSLMGAIRMGGRFVSAEVAVIPQGSEGRGTTWHVDFHTTKPVSPATRCHLNAMVADTAKWEQKAAWILDHHAGVARWVKNDQHVGLFIPYRRPDRRLARYIPDFLVVTQSGARLIIEIKGQMDDAARLKAKAAERWCAAVNRLEQYGQWRYLLVMDPDDLWTLLNEITGLSTDPPSSLTLAP